MITSIQPINLTPPQLPPNKVNTIFHSTLTQTFESDVFITAYRPSCHDSLAEIIAMFIFKRGKQ